MTHWFDRILRNDFSSFIGKTLATCDPGAEFAPNWHIDLIGEYLQAAERGEITRLIINMPPRSLKSVCVSVAWPAWLLGHDPRRRVMAASYSGRLAIKHSLDCRAVVGSDWYQRVFPDVALARDQNQKHKFMTTQRGFRFATSVGGTITGEGGNFLIMDDPISPLQAANKHYRDFVNRWFENTFASRLDDKKKGVIVLVMQRLHTEDLSGYLLEKGGWEHVCLPMVAASEKIFDFGRVQKKVAVGEILHSARETPETIERSKREMGSTAFAAQYQQQPVSEESAMVKQFWFARHTQPPILVQRRVQSWDTAIKSGAKHDASVCLSFIESEGKSYLVDVSVARLEYPDLKRYFYALSKRFEPDAILLEDKASGQQLLQDVRREAALPVIATTPRGDKITRFAAICAMIEAGRVSLPQQASWLADFEHEVFSFPNGAHDDQVDALTQYLDWLRGKGLERAGIRRI